MKGLSRIMAIYAMMMPNLTNEAHFMSGKRGTKPLRAPLSPDELGKKRGLTKFTYEDGFETWAINAKNADRKHQNYLKNNEI
jgi:hypothetical protein